ncbi:MAG: hypothetical protein ACKOU7_02695 [Ferruginibacter sp.]
MKKIILILTLLLTGFLFCNAQFKQIAEGPGFAEPEEGFAKILNMKNGNTFYLNISLKDGINIRIYDVTHIQTVTTAFSPAYETLKTGDVEAIFEIAADVVVFISERDDRTPVLYRLIIDGNTGKLKEEKTIARMRKEGAFVNTSRYKSFYVSKDLYTDNYAVILYSVMESDIEKRMEIIHYGSNNNEISRNFFASADKENKFFFYIDMVVMGSDKVCAFLFASEDKYEFGKKGNMVLATLQKGSVSYATLNTGDEVRVNWGLGKYNPVTKKILFLTAAQLGKRKNTYMAYQTSGKATYQPYLFMIDPISNTITSDGDIGANEKLYTYYKEQFDKKDDYAGMPQNLFINDDGGFAIVYEEIMVQRQSSQSSGFGSSSTIRVDTKLGKMVVATYDQKGILASAYLVPKEHWVIFQELSPFYHARREGSAQLLYRGNQYKSFAYLNGVSKNYILFNDTERNNEVKKDKFVEVQGVSDCDAFMYKLAGNDVAPKREYAFGAPAKGHTLALYAISDYDKKSNVYVTLKLDKESPANKEVKLVWLQPQ